MATGRLRNVEDSPTSCVHSTSLVGQALKGAEKRSSCRTGHFGTGLPLPADPPTITSWTGVGPLSILGQAMASSLSVAAWQHLSAKTSSFREIKPLVSMQMGTCL